MDQYTVVMYVHCVNPDTFAKYVMTKSLYVVIRVAQPLRYPVVVVVVVVYLVIVIVL